MWRHANSKAGRTSRADHSGLYARDIIPVGNTSFCDLGHEYVRHNVMRPSAIRRLMTLGEAGPGNC